MKIRKEYKMPKLELYIKPTCPYCMKVVRFLEKNNLDIPLLNIDEDNKMCIRDSRSSLELRQISTDL